MKKFDKSYTFAIKGLAILIMVFHHITYTEIQIPLKQFDINIIVSIVTKVCVAIFTILSGYGLTKSYENKCENCTDIKFIFNHIKKLLINYWYIYIPCFILSFKINILGTPFQIYGNGLLGGLRFLLEFFGLSGFFKFKNIFYATTLTEVWWYISAIIIFYLLYPLLYKLIKKIPIITILLSLIPCILHDTGYYINFLCTVNREIYYIFPFLVGIFLAKKDFLDKLVNYCSINHKNRINTILYSIIGIVIFSILSTQFWLTSNVFNAFYIIILCISIKSFGLKLNSIFEFLGKHSMNIFLIHPFFQVFFMPFNTIIYYVKSVFLKLIIVVVFSLIASIAIEYIKKFIDNKLEQYRIKMGEANESRSE